MTVSLIIFYFSYLKKLTCDEIDLVYICLNFDVHVGLCNHQHNQDAYKFHQPQTTWSCPSVVTFLPTPAPDNADLLSIAVALSFQECHIKGIT